MTVPCQARVRSSHPSSPVHWYPRWVQAQAEVQTLCVAIWTQTSAPNLSMACAPFPHHHLQQWGQRYLLPGVYPHLARGPSQHHLSTRPLALVAREPRLEALLSSEDRTVNGVYRPDVEDPQLCNPFATSAYELRLLLTAHVDARVREAAADLTNYTRA